MKVNLTNLEFIICPSCGKIYNHKSELGVMGQCRYCGYENYNGCGDLLSVKDIMTKKENQHNDFYDVNLYEFIVSLMSVLGVQYD